MNVLRVWSLHQLGGQHLRMEGLLSSLKELETGTLTLPVSVLPWILYTIMVTTRSQNSGDTKK